MNPTDLAESVRLLAERMFRLPTVVPRELLDGISFEDTEAALSRQLGAYLPGPAVRHSVADDRGGAFPEPPRTGDPRLVRFGLPHIDRTSRALTGPPVSPLPRPAGVTVAAPTGKVPGDDGSVLPGVPRPVQHGGNLSNPTEMADLAHPTDAVHPADLAGLRPPDDARQDEPGTTDSVLPGTTGPALSATDQPVLPRVTGPRLPGETTQARASERPPTHPLQWTDAPSGAEVTLLERGASALAAMLGAATPDIDTPVEPDPDVVLQRLRDQLELEFHRTYGEW